VGVSVGVGVGVGEWLCRGGEWGYGGWDKGEVGSVGTGVKIPL